MSGPTYDRPSDSEIVEGVKKFGSITAYAKEIGANRRTVHDWHRVALENESLRHLSKEGKVSLKFKDGTERVFTEEEVNNYFLAFSSKGRDLNTRQMLNEFGLTPMEWHKIKSMFRIYKLSNIFWDETLNKIAPSKREEAIEERLGVAYENTNKLVDRAYTKAQQRHLKKEIENKAFFQEYTKEFFSCLTESDSNLPVTEVLWTKQKGATGPAIIAAISDIHIGSKNLDLQGNEVHSTSIIRNHFQTVAEGINERRSKDVTLLINGDIIESFTGTMHPNTFQDMEHQATYANSIILARNLLVELVGNIANVKKICVISGNHDRLSSKYSEDTLGGAAHLIAEFLKLYYPKVKVDWSPLILKHELNGVTFLFSHGHKKFCEKDFYKNILEHGNPESYNVLILGHFHNRGIRHDSEKGRLIVLPSIAQGGSFATDHGFSAKAGYSIFGAKGGKPRHTDITL